MKETSSTPLRQPEPIRPQDCYKAYTFDQDKACSPVETVKLFRQRLKEVNLDILREVRRIDNGRLDIPVYFSVCGEDAHEIIGTKKQMGKGSSPEQSQASACMELAERFSFFSFKKNPANFITACYPDIKTSAYPILPLEKLLQSVHDTETGPETLERLLAEIPIQWTWATHLNSGRLVLIPFSWFYAINEFNGPAAGNTYEEALIQGISEIVERHVSAVVSHERLKTPAIDLASINDPVARELIGKFTRNGIEVYLNDFTLDTGIPTVAALAIDRKTFPELSEIVYTAGTTPDPDKSIIRALTEVAQLAGDFNTRANYVASGLPKPLAMSEVDYITHPGKTITAGQMADLRHDNLKVEINNYLASLKNIDMEVYVIDAMHPGLRIPAIYTIVPGAHFRERSRIKNAGLFAAKLLAERVGDADESNRRLKRMQKILPDAYFIEFYLGRNLFNSGRSRDALPHFEKALAQEPAGEDLPYIYSYMGNCLKELECYGEAVTMLRKGTDLDDERPDLHNLLGFCHFKLGQYDTAVRHFTRTVELNPSSAIDYANLGVNYRKLGRKDEAVKYLELALALDPAIDFAREHLEQMRGVSST